jgi:hypothetical protein
MTYEAHVEGQLARALDSLAESLRVPKHLDVLAPLRARAKAVLARYFERERDLLLAEIEPALRSVAAGNPNVKEAAQAWTLRNGFLSAPLAQRLREASAEDAKRAIVAVLPDASKLPSAVTQGLAVDYEATMRAAIAAGFDGQAADLGAARTISADVTAAYLRERSLEALASKMAATTVERIQTALATAYEAGADYDGLVAAVKDEYAGMTDRRAATIAQTGMNAAYNAGRVQLGLDMGFDEKAWSIDGTLACDDCLANVAMGWIGIGMPFLSGDEFPPLHPNCDCSIDVRASSAAVAA